MAEAAFNVLAGIDSGPAANLLRKCTRLFGYYLFISLALPCVAYSQDVTGDFSEVAESCISSPDPLACMASYGFSCDAARMPQMSLDAHIVSCSLPLPDGYRQDVQILYEGGGWSIEHQSKYMEEPEEHRSPVDDAGFALSTFIREEMRQESILSSGSKHEARFDGPVHLQIGYQWIGERRTMRGICGVVFGGPDVETSSAELVTACEKDLLQMIRRISQPASVSPYVAAGAKQVNWQSRFVTIASGDGALIVEGRYTFDRNHKSCRLINDCCSTDGSVYLDSCRAPTETELRSVETCLADGLELNSDEYIACLREADIKVGCEENSDDWRLCY